MDAGFQEGRAGRRRTGKTFSLTALFLLIFEDDAEVKLLNVSGMARSDRVSLSPLERPDSRPWFCLRGHHQPGQPVTSSIHTPTPPGRGWTGPGWESLVYGPQSYRKRRING
nr:uncharacterized protein LOC105497849 [Macaca nemestrina]